MKGKGKQETYWLLGDTEKNEVFIHIFIPNLWFILMLMFMFLYIYVWFNFLKVRRMKMAPDESKLKPFFRGPQNLVNNVGANSQEVRKFEKNPVDFSF